MRCEGKFNFLNVSENFNLKYASQATDFGTSCVWPFDFYFSRFRKYYATEYWRDAFAAIPFQR